MAELDKRSLEAGYETSDAEIKPIALFLAVLGVLLVAAFLAMGATFSALAGLRDASVGVATTEFDQRQRPPAPRLQPVPADDLQQLRLREREALDGYRWIDREAGRLQIPVERAMELLLEEGLPTREEQP